MKRALRLGQALRRLARPTNDIGQARVAVWLAAAALLAGCSLAGDITPPPALATAQAAAPIPTNVPVSQPLVPNAPPDLAAGELIYAERCAACHGPQAMGDGEMAPQLSFPPAALADAEVAGAASPEAWYQIVTNGNLERLMPPFASLSDQQRWDVVGYALSLSLSGDELRAGEALFAEQCVDCHSAADFADQYYRGAARQSIAAVIRDGRGSEMPGFGEQLEDNQLGSLAGYVQSLAWSTGAEAEPAAEQPAADLVTVTGSVANGTLNGSVPADLQVEIQGFDGEQQVLQETVSLNAQGGFELEQVESPVGRLFMASVEYQGVLYRSEIVHAPSDGAPLELPLTIYESSGDADALRVEQMHLLIEFPDEQTMRVLQLWVVGNRSDRVVTPSLRVPLPDVAFNLGFEQGGFGDRYERTETGFLDLEPVPPGSGIDQLVFGFDLLRDGVLEYRQLLEHPVEAVTVLVSEDAPRISGLIDEGVRDLGGLRMHGYTATGLEAGDILSFRVAGPSGLPMHAASVAIGGLALLAALLVAVRSRSDREPDEVPIGAELVESQAMEQEQLLLEIAQLDADHEAGRLDTAEWQRERENLKRMALERMRNNDG